jgi:hypothetical protein
MIEDINKYIKQSFLISYKCMCEDIWVIMDSIVSGAKMRKGNVLKPQVKYMQDKIDDFNLIQNLNDEISKLNFYDYSS